MKKKEEEAEEEERKHNRTSFTMMNETYKTCERDRMNEKKNFHRNMITINDRIYNHLKQFPFFLSLMDSQFDYEIRYQSTVNIYEYINTLLSSHKYEQVFIFSFFPFENLN